MEYAGKKRCCFAGESAIWIQNRDPANILGLIYPVQKHIDGS